MVAPPRAGRAAARGSPGCPAGRARWSARRARAGRGARSRAPASPSRCRMPREYLPTGRRPTSASPTCSSAASTLPRRPRPLPGPAASSASRLARPDSRAWWAGPSMSAPTRGSTLRRCLGMDSPSTSTSPDVASTRPSSIRTVVVLPEPFAPRKPNTSPRRTSRSTPSTAVSLPNRLVSPRVRMTASSWAPRRAVAVSGSVVSGPVVPGSRGFWGGGQDCLSRRPAAAARNVSRVSVPVTRYPGSARRRRAQHETERPHRHRDVLACHHRTGRRLQLPAQSGEHVARQRQRDDGG